ncbi:MAG: protein kinase [Acidobacteria bacterium]|nr:protein kinase [Acidobacteriota bacterium]
MGITFARGTELSRYRIVERIGAGGMGEVYSAEDPTLGRKVALKILPSELVENEQRVARFVREAKTASGLDHPHIVTIHEIGEAQVSPDGAATPSTIHYIAMELVHGSTLARKIHEERTELRERVRWLAQAADAVAKAHDAGIIHRDLKPENIMVTADGYAKVLDFGLAKLTETGEVSADKTTAAMDRDTAEGVVLGTLAYMSPEQARGQRVDARSDIFSFGSILYEAVTGQRPFEGDEKIELAHAIVSQKPKPIRELNLACPDELRKLIGRCLRKSPDRRYQSMKDIAIELAEMAEDWETLSVGGSTSSGATVPFSGIRHAGWKTWLAVAGVVIGLLAAGGILTELWRSQSTVAPATSSPRFQLEPPSGVLIEESGAQTTFSLSPDGRLIAFMTRGGERQIYLRSIDEIEARPFVDGSDPFFSPDSQWLGYRSGGRIWKIPVTGGMPIPICDAPRVRGASWGEDGTILFSAGKGLLRVDENGSEPEIVTDPETDSTGIRHYWPQYLPGGKAALMTIHKGVTERNRELAVVTLDTGEIRTLVTGGTSLRFTPNGYLLFNRYGTLHAAPFDLEDLEITGEIRPVLEDIYYYPGSGFTAAELSRDGALSYIPGAPGLRDAELVWIDRAGVVEPADESSRPFGALTFSPDGRYLAANIREDLSESRVHIQDLRTGGWRSLPGRVASSRLVWSSEGKWIYTSAIRNGRPQVARIAADRTTPPEPVTPGDLPHWEYVNSVAPDGRLLYQKQVAAAQWDLYLIEPDGKGRPEPFLATPALEAMGNFSPEGRWVAYESFETGSREIHVRPYPEGAPRITITTEGGSVPFWNPNGEELFYRCGKTAYCVVPVETEPTFSAGEPRILFEADFLPRHWQTSIDVAPDGERFLVIRPAPEEVPERKIVYIPNWVHELDRIYKEGGIR